MNVTDAKFQEAGLISATVDGVLQTFVDDPDNRFRRAVADWEALGNTIEPFVAPEPPKPTDTPLTRVQFKAIVAILGFNQQQIFDAIDSVVSDPVENAIAKARVTDSDNYRRDNPLFSLLGPVIGISNEALDGAWEQALMIG